MSDQDGLIQAIVRRFVTGPLTPMLLIVAAVAGIVAIERTPREEEPQIVVPMADVEIAMPGASPEEVERLVATPLEKLLWQIDGVEHVYSVSRRGGAVVTVRFFVGEDRERALIRLRDRIEAHRDLAPPGVMGWVVRPLGIDDVPIVALTLWSAAVDDAALRRVAEELAARVESVPNLSRTEIIGGRPREIRVELDPEAVAARGLSPLDVVGALRAADAATVAGAFDRGDRRVSVLAGPSVASGAEASEIVVGTHDGRPVRVRDVARVLDGPAEATSYVRVTGGAAPHDTTLEPGTAHPAVTIAFGKKRGTNAVDVAEALLERLEAVTPELLPAGVHVLVTRNYGATANAKVDELLGHLALAIVTVIALIAFSLGWREGLIVAAAVPLTFALTLFVNMIAGYSVNRVTLFALVLVLGLVVDDPIVDVENVHRHFARRTRPPLDAVLFAINEVRPPIIVATLAVIVSFLPMLFITGMMGPYMRPMALNVPVAMAMSMVVAFTMTPWMAYLVLRSRYGHAEAGAEENEGGAAATAYRRLLRALLERRSARRALWLGLAGLAVAAALLVVAGAVPLKMLPYDNKSELQVVVDLPESATLEATDAAVRDLERVLAAIPETTNVVSYVGVPSPLDFNGLVRRYNFRHAPNLADLRVNLVDKEERHQQSHAIGLALRAALDRVAERHDAKIAVVEMPPGPPVLATIVAEVRGTPTVSHETLVAAAHDLAERLAGEAGVVDVDVMSETPHQRLDFVLDKAKAALHGISTAEVVATVRTALGGDAVATVHDPHERQPLRLVVRLPRARRSGAAELGALRLRGRDGRLVPLGEIGRFVDAAEMQPIYHKDLERVVFVTAEIAGRPPADVVFAMGDSLEAAPLPSGTTADWAGEGEWKITIDVFRDLGIAFAAALVGIYVLLVIETGSLVLPLVVMLAIPLGLIGIAPGFWALNLLTGTTVGGFADPVWFTATGMIGMITLAGIVVRNAVLLIDFVRAARAAGTPLDDAIVESGVRRFRPIMLTAGTAMLGAWPITLDPIFAGLAWSLIFGLLASTAFTLIVVPVVYRRVAP